MNIHTVFVYGTLRKNGSNSSLLKGSEYIGKDSVPGFILRDLGEYPMAFENTETGVSIIIEIYNINDKTLRQLDILEEFTESDSNSLYLRKKVLSGSGTSGWIYYGNDEGKYISYEIIPEGDWIKLHERSFR